MKEYAFLTTCVGVPERDVEALIDMIDTAIDIKWATFKKHCDFEDIQRDLKTLNDDYCVGFYRSKYKGQRVYFFTHSAIEHIFARN